MHLFKENHDFSSFFSASLNSTSSSSSSSSDVLGLGASKEGIFLLLSPSSKPLVSPKSKLLDGSEEREIQQKEKRHPWTWKSNGKTAESHYISQCIFVKDDDTEPQIKPHVFTCGPPSHFNKSSRHLWQKKCQNLSYILNLNDLLADCLTQNTNI